MNEQARNLFTSWLQRQLGPLFIIVLLFILFFMPVIMPPPPPPLSLLFGSLSRDFGQVAESFISGNVGFGLGI